MAGRDGFFSAIEEGYDWLTGKKRGGFSKYDRVVDRTLEQIPDKMPYKPKYTKASKKRAYGSKPRTSMKKRKRTYSRTYKPRKVVRKKYKKTTSASDGLMDVSKAATAPKYHVAIDRRKTFGSVENHSNSKMAWIGGCDIGDQQTFCRNIARAILQKYLAKMGDVRTAVDADDDHADAKLFKSFIVTYKIDSYSTAHLGEGIEDHDHGNNIDNSSLVTMGDTLGDQIFAKAERGFYPSSIKFHSGDFVDAAETEARGHPVISDYRLGEHYLDIQVTTLFRLHNITPSDTTDAGENPANSVHDINANPISGKIFTFRNQRPVFHSGYVDFKKDDPTTQDGIERLNRYDNNFDVIKRFATTKDAFAHIAAPPLNAKTIWSNVSGQGTIRMAPGAYRTYNAKFLRSGTVRQLIRDAIRVRVDAGTSTDPSNGLATKNPPLGSSWLFCFQPSMRTSNDELVKLGYDQTQVYKTSLRFKKALGIPTRDIMVE